MSSLRAKLLVAFVAFALLAVGGLALAGVGIVRDRARAHAAQTFHAARAQLDRSLALRFDVFRATTELSYTLPVFRGGAAHVDPSEFGFGGRSEDEAALESIYQSLSDSTWDWASIAGEGFLAIADYKGRLVYIHGREERYGWRSRDGVPFHGTATDLPLVRELLGGREADSIAAVIAADDPALTRLALGDGKAGGAFVVFARKLSFEGTPKALLLQGVRADRLLEDVALVDQRTAMGLLAPGGARAGDLPEELEAPGLALGGDAPATIRALGRDWLVQRHPLRGVAPGDPPIATLVVARDLDEGLRQLEQAATGLVGVALALGLAGIGAALVLSRRISGPVVELDRAAREVAAGNLDVRVPVRSRDEVGRLAGAFNEMTEGLRERDRIKSTFKKYLAPEVVEYLLAHPEAQALGGERKRLTVLFSDLAGFTSISEDRAPEQVIGILNEYLSLVARRVVARGGTLDKFIGDAVMAFFGAPVPRADHPVRACQAALDHLAVLDELRPRWESGAWPELDVRVGVNTGDMLVGNVGGDEGRDYTVIGDAVNLASRLEGANKEYGTRILVSEAVRDEVGAAFELRELDLLQVKGKDRPVRVFELLGEPGHLARHPPLASTVSQFAAGLAAYRALDLAAARRAFEAALVATPGDGPSRTFLARCRTLEAAPPPAGWTGVHKLDVK